MKERVRELCKTEALLYCEPDITYSASDATRASTARTSSSPLRSLHDLPPTHPRPRDLQPWPLSLLHLPPLLRLHQRRPWWRRRSLLHLLLVIVVHLFH
ncbi:hypothetical protein QJS10_CPA01g02069 [Acorus calamus]|uniref:Uncharacterized protein n=1 Tax=Acorus calamus TaxID=4465 RepID=A0AAV9FKB8_ACOCL|nr:hypothetical protein QJS10_CPA01g02069 [Acorus calamus]